MPIWGGDETLGKARAIENRVFIASSGYLSLIFWTSGASSCILAAERACLSDTGIMQVRTITVSKMIAMP